MAITQENLQAQTEVPEAANTPPIQINNHINSSPNRFSHRIGWKGRALAAGLVVGGLLVGSRFIDNGGEATPTINHSEVTFVGPANVDERAIIEMRIGPSVHYQPSEDVLDRDLIDPIPFIGSLNKSLDNRFEKSQGETVTLTGAGGKGKAKLYTLVGLSYKDDQPVRSPDGKITYYVNTSGIRLLTGFFENDTMNVDDNGNLLQARETIGGFIPGTEGIKHSDEVRTGTMEQDTRELAANTAQATCVSAALPLAELAITKSLANDAITSYKLEVAGGANLMHLTRKDVSVVFQGDTPTFPKPYPHLSEDGYKFKSSVDPECKVVTNALHLDGKITGANGGPLPNLNS